MIKFADVVIGLSYGDEGKGKVVNSLLKSREYTHCMRFNGSSNAGHTIYRDDKKIVTHVIPTGIIQGIKSIIGPGCVVSPKMLDEEIMELYASNIDVENLLFIDKRTNIVTSNHLAEDSKDKQIGTTKRGNGPAYRDKYARKNMRFGEFEWKNKPYSVIDVYEELVNSKEEASLLMEGAQAFGLDIDWGDYPFVTSSHCGVSGVIQNGIPFNKIRRVYGVCKAYDTYVGAKNFEKSQPIFETIRQVGNEFGATTGRPRQVDYLDLDLLKRSAKINSVSHLIINKVDVLESVDTWKLKNDGQTIDLANRETFEKYVENFMFSNIDTLQHIKFSSSPKDI